MILPPFNLPDGILLLITDELASPADFLLYHAFISHAKGDETARTIFISVSEDFARAKAVCAKSNTNVPSLLSSGKLTFIDALSHIESSLDPNVPTLLPLLDLVTPILESNPKHHNLVILDDITSLNWIGFSLLDVFRFLRAFAAKCRQLNATLVIRHHIVTPGDPDELFRHLLHLCTYHLEVRALASGRSGTVSGEVALHPGMATITGSVKLIPRSSALQYRLTDAGAVFFERGTSEGVL